MRVISLVVSIFLGLVSCVESKLDKPNVLFICVDDLRAELGCYGDDYVISPNLDKLASDGYLFKNQFVTVPTCGASRQSMLTGQLPISKAYLDNSITSKVLSDKEEGAIPETFVHQLKRSGYYTVGIGKISHHPDGYLYGYQEEPSDKLELPHSWNEMLFDSGKWGSGHNAFFGYADGTNRNDLNKQVKPYEMADVSDSGYVDGLTAELAMKKLEDLKDRDQPFFLGVGFIKPHLPFNAPKKYWDLYDEDSISLSKTPFIPENVDKASLHGSGEFNQYKLGDERASLDKPVSDRYARKLRHGYYASISYIDAQIGKLLDKLESEGLSDNTIVVVWGDHGWHLGDHLVWGKHTIFEKALRSAFMIRLPNGKQGTDLDQIVSSADIYPTIMDLCGVTVNHHLDGSSLVELLNSPTDSDWNNVAYSYYRNGISVRTERYRLTKYFRSEQPVIELYDHLNDPTESVNIADSNIDIVNRLMPILERGDTGLFN